MKNPIAIYKKLPLPAKASLWFLASTLLNKCMSLITVPLFTRIMDQSQYGLYSTYLSVLSVVTVLCTMNFSSCAYINGYVKFETEKEKNELATSLLSLDLVLTGSLFLVYWFFRSFFNDLLGLTTPLMCAIFAAVLFTPSVRFWIIREKFRYKYIGAVVVSLSMVILNALFGVWFVMVSKVEDQAVARAVSIVLVQAVFGIVITIYYWRKSGFFKLTKYWKYGLKLNLPLIPHSLSIDILSSADRVMLTTMTDSSVTAVYSVAVSASQIITAIKLSVVDAVRPWMYEKLKAKDYASIRRNSTMILIAMIMLTFLFVAFAPELLMVFAPKKYSDAIYAIPAVAGSTYFTFIYNMCSIVEIFYEKNTKIMIASVTAAATNIGLNAVFIPLFGFVAAGYTTLFSYMVLCVMHFIFTRQVCREKADGAQVLDLKLTIVLSLIVLGFIAFFTFLYSYIVLRYIVIALMLIVCFVYRKQAIKIFKEMKSAKKKKQKTNE